MRMRVLYVLHLVAIKLFRLGWCPGEEMWADHFTKALSCVLSRKHSAIMQGNRTPVREKNMDAFGNPRQQSSPENKDDDIDPEDL